MNSAVIFEVHMNEHRVTSLKAAFMIQNRNETATVVQMRLPFVTNFIIKKKTKKESITNLHLYGCLYESN